MILGVYVGAELFRKHGPNVHLGRVYLRETQACWNSHLQDKLKEVSGKNLLTLLPADLCDFSCFLNKYFLVTKVKNPCKWRKVSPLEK